MGTLHYIAVLGLSIAVLCATAIAIVVICRPLSMGIMNLVWPVSALFGSIAVAWFFLRYARSTKQVSDTVAIAKGCLHCGSGCTLGDLIAEGLIGLAPFFAILTGWHWLFTDKMFASWILDTLFAFGFGIIFQYFAIAPMRHLGVREGLKAAVKADIASLAAWQVGMFIIMATAQLWVFPTLVGYRLVPTTAIFWFVMQLAMAGGFLASYPVNAWLIRAKIKERM